MRLIRSRIGNIAGPSSYAINFSPSGAAKLFVSDSYLYGVGSTEISGAILLRPASGVTANVTIERTRIENNRFGIIADGNPGGIIRGGVIDSIVSGNTNNGITVSTSSSNVVLTIDNTKVMHNNFGLVATGSNAGMLVRRSVINTNNGTGLFTSGGGVLLSYQDNSVNVYTSDGAFTGSVGLK